ncbi:lipopolysaccharide-responsive and beige-like anchor protein [Brienomyrus brachyistius]|uniref:lipopolysaccharide-responsive and beige-like anchor protein n=1 Tax=Brienomyrus brachyistius TaxID=42636 RepID=UPI0020B382B4|nr:lipopolysaccharide-responsive and beige-like anchor protein [Brienomyrus brachyistius]
MAMAGRTEPLHEAAALSRNSRVAIRGIRMKFALLYSLVEAGQVSNRDIVETVLNLLVGGQFDLEMNFTIQEPDGVSCMVDLLDRCEPACQAELWSTVTAMLKKSALNLHVCATAGLTELLLARLAQANSAVVEPLIDVLAVLTRYSITVKELKLLFSKLQGEDGMWPPHALRLLSVLKSMPCRSGPDSSFSFPGKSVSAIALPPIAKWPYQTGFTFHTWLCLHPAPSVSVHQDKLHLYCFRSSRGQGYAAHFEGQGLIVTSLKAKGQSSQHCMKYNFKPQKWYMLTIVHIYNRWRNSEICCYVDGEMVSCGEMAWPLSTSDTFDKCFLGSAETLDANQVLCGQMGAVYLFSEALNATQILAIYQLGPSYKGAFKYKCESDLVISEQQRALLYDGRLYGCIAFTYNPRATDGQLCLECSGRDRPSLFLHPPHALMLQNTRAMVSHSVQSAIHSLGGVQALFPLFMQLDYLQDPSDMTDTSVCCSLLAFLMELLRSSVAMQEQMLASKGFLVIGYALEKSSKEHVTLAVLDLFLAFSRYLSGLQGGQLLLRQLCDHILFSPAIWIHAPAKVQRNLYAYLSTEFISTETIYSGTRKMGTALQVMHTIKYFYWVVNPEDRSGVMPRGLDGPRPSRKEMLSLRAFLLLFIKQFILKDFGTVDEVLDSILSHLLTLHEEDNLMDVLQLLVALMAEHPAHMVPAFQRQSGIRVVYKLLASDSDAVRVQALKALGYFLQNLDHRRKAEVMVAHNLFSLLSQRLMLHADRVTMTTYNALYEILTEQICTQVIHTPHPDSNSSVRIVNPQVLKVITELLDGSPPCPAAFEVRRLFLSDMIKLFGTSWENRRSLLQCSLWQKWLLSLCRVQPQSSEEQKISEMVYTVFRILLGHAIKHELGGWRVWVDTLSITHTKVASEKPDITFHECQRMAGGERGSSETSIISEGRVPSTGAPTGPGPSGTMQAEVAKPLNMASTPDLKPIDKAAEQRPLVNEGACGAMRSGLSSPDVSHHGEGLQGKPAVPADAEMITDVKRAGVTENNGTETEDLGSISAQTKVSRESSEEGDGGEEERRRLGTPWAARVTRPEVSGVASDSARLKGLASADSALGHEEEASQSSEGRTTGVPELQWSHMHQRLLSDLLSSIETEVQAWRSHSTRSLLDPENLVFVRNSIHVLLQVVDTMVVGCGHIQALLSAATFATAGPESVEPLQGMSDAATVAFLQRLLSLADVLLLSSSLSLAELEAERRLSPGAALRQSLRLVCTVAVWRYLERQQVSCSDSSSPKLLAGAVGPPGAHLLQDSDLPGDEQNGLLRDVDLERLRSVVFRNFDDSQQAQFLALAVVHFISVLMVSKYKDLLEPHKGGKGRDVGIAPSCPPITRTESSLGQERASPTGGHAEELDAVRKVLGSLSSEVKQQREMAACSSSSSPRSSSSHGGRCSNVKEILRSLVGSSTQDILVDPSLPSLSFLEAMGHAPQRGTCSLERSGSVQPRKTLPPFGPTSASSENFLGPPHIGSAAVKPMGDAEPIEGGCPSTKPPPTSPATPTATQDSAFGMSVSRRLELVLRRPATLLREIFVDFAPFLSRTLLGSHGQELLAEGTSLVFLQPHGSVVELVMLLCSQEWQTSIERNAGPAFAELVSEGRLLNDTINEHLLRVASEAEVILSHQQDNDVRKHADFEAQCAQHSAERRAEASARHGLIAAARHRDQALAAQLVQKITRVLTEQSSARSGSSLSQSRHFWRLDPWEDDLRRRRRLVWNPLGSTHPEAVLKATAEDEEDALKGGESIRRQTVRQHSRPTDGVGDGGEDALSSLEEKDPASLTGTVLFSADAQLVCPAGVFQGTLSVTASELYFEVDEEEPSFKKTDPKILAYTDGLHGKWLFSEIRAVFSRRYLLQDTALEVFLACKTAVMFNFPDAATVKKIVRHLPCVGVGNTYGHPQSRRMSLASPRQLFRTSNMAQRWQRGEISNFEYLMFLNTISGRTYNDLNQYPVFPWVIANYESEELDLELPSNFRDLSKPMGALNPKRAALFSERFDTWEDEQVPRFHYGTHYSTCSFTLMWLLRLEPFTTFFLNFQGGKFDHADRSFSSVWRAWRNCQEDTSDVKELIPEFYYLPEMFYNANDFNLGVMDDGTVVSDVQLPPWAKSPEDFVRINRLALESEMVSRQLHQWIDLIFGFKQQGPEAAKALNVFYYLTYEGAVNLSTITEPRVREAVEAQIRSFGQTPSQLLSEPHPLRGAAVAVPPSMSCKQTQSGVIMVLKFPTNSPVTHVSAHTQPGSPGGALVTVTASRIFGINKWHCVADTPGTSFPGQMCHPPVEMDPLLASGPPPPRRQIADPLDRSVCLHAHSVVVTADARFILACGFWDGSFRIYSADSGKLSQVVFGHRDVVTCLTRSESYMNGDCYIVSGSRDAALLLWYWNGRTGGIGKNGGQRETPMAMMTGHGQQVTCVSVCAELGLVLSGSADGPCLIHSITGDLLRTLESPAGCQHPLLARLSGEGLCVVCYQQGQICTFSINGKLLARCELDEDVRAILLSPDGQCVFSGGDGGVLRVWRAQNLQQLFIYPGCDAGICSLAMSHDQRCVIAGMASGSMVIFYSDFSRRPERAAARASEMPPCQEHVGSVN